MTNALERKVLQAHIEVMHWCDCVVGSLLLSGHRLSDMRFCSMQTIDGGFTYWIELHGDTVGEFEISFKSLFS